MTAIPILHFSSPLLDFYWVSIADKSDRLKTVVLTLEDGLIKDIDRVQEQLTQTKTSIMRVLTQLSTKPEGMDCATNTWRILAQLEQHE